MELQQQPSVPIVVELARVFHVTSDANAAQRLQRSIADQLTARMLAYGLNGEPRIQIREASSSRAVRVRVHGSVQPYRPELMMAVWQNAQLFASPGGFWEIKWMDSPLPDGWLLTYAAELHASGERDWTFLSGYIGRLVVEIICQRPGRLVGPEQATAFLPAQLVNDQYVDMGELAVLLESLLNLGISLADKQPILAALRDGRRVGRSISDTVEAAFALLRSSRNRMATGALADAIETVTVEDTERRLEFVSREHPDLVRSALEYLSPEQLTRIIRALIAQHVSVRDFRGILQRVLDFQTASLELIFDDEQRLTSDNGDVDGDNCWKYVEFIRLGFRTQFSKQYADASGELRCYETDPDLEQRLPQLSEEDRESLRDRIWLRMTMSGAPTFRPIVLTSQPARRFLHEALSPEMPECVVLGRGELLPGVGIVSQPL